MTLAMRSNRGLVNPFDTVTRDLDTFVNHVFNRPAAPTPYGVDIREDADHLNVTVDLPGFTREQVDVTIDNNVLTITADRENNVSDNGDATPKPEGDGGTWLLRERRFARFERSFALPNTVDGSAIDAKLADGVLHVRLNKRQELKPRKIKIG